MPRSLPPRRQKTRPRTHGGVNATCSPGSNVSYPLLLDEMFSGVIAGQLRAKGHDVLAVVTDPALVALPDDQVLAHAATAGRALVTANIKDFIPLDARYRAAGRARRRSGPAAGQLRPGRALPGGCRPGHRRRPPDRSAAAARP